jgi:hypothetical protein
MKAHGKMRTWCGLILAFVAGPACAATLNSSGDGAFNSPSTWGGTAVPAIGDTVVVKNGHTVTFSDGCAFTNGKITVSSGGVFAMSGGTVTGTTVAVNGTFRHSGGTFTRGAEISVSGASSFWEMTGGTNSAKSFSTGNLRDMTTVCARLSGGYFAPVTLIHEGRRISVEGGCKTGLSVSWQIPQNATDSSAVSFVGNTNYFSGIFALGSGGNSTRYATTGHVDVVNSELVFTNSIAYPPAARSTAEGRFSLVNSRVWHLNSLEVSSGVKTTNGSTYGLEVGPGSQLVVGGSGIDSEETPIWDVPNSTLFASASRNLWVGNNAVFRQTGGRVRVADRFFLAAGAKVEITGGSLETKRVFTGYGYTEPDINISMSGGAWTMTGSAMYLGRDANNNSSIVPSIYFHHTGGMITNAWAGQIELGGCSTNGVVRYVLDGGELGKNTVFLINTNNVAEIVMKGSASKPMIGGFTINSSTGGQNNFLLEYLFDSSEEHISPWTFILGSATRCGNLRLRPDGGVMVTATNKFTLMKLDPYWDGTGEMKFFGTFLKLNNGNAKTQNFRSLPDPSLWTVSLSEDAYSVYATLAEPVASFGGMSGTADFSASPLPMGSVELSNVRKGNLKTWFARLKVTGADGGALAPEKLESLADALVAAGYTNSSASASSEYNLTVGVPPELMASGKTRFVWDFTRTESARTVDAVKTNALVVAVSAVAEPVVTGLKIIMK